MDYDRWRLMTPEEDKPWAYEWADEDGEDEQETTVTCWSCGEEVDIDEAVPDGTCWLCETCAELPLMDEEGEVTEVHGTPDGGSLDCA
ncbi:hypothetical protein [Alicyclobacillus vulcanalis]|uniref:Uncharacterized protein n=1 Tax=Alicyclobacillus vulcanalis TaxID=252246 RepID=A0A1N7MSC6_9BACL|nr:hypothetical protein [Alicyclobacillus vulcanalis]SIS88960.1 hypothetical protein SAMN05421799_10670 [Alicyclobacillus vulcanalis]